MSLSTLENTERSDVSAARVAEGETADEKSKGIEDFQPRCRAGYYAVTFQVSDLATRIID